MNCFRAASIMILMLLTLSSAHSATCPNRGELSEEYCDSDYNLVADTPTDPDKLITPKTLIYSFTPFDGASQVFSHFTKYLEQCLNTKTIFYPMQSNEAEIEAMHANRLHLSGFSSGSTVTAVNKAGAIPFATKGNEQGLVASHMVLIVRSDSPYREAQDLKGKRVAHTNPTSNSGHFAALSIFPKMGISPGIDYTIIYSGQHGRSIRGVKSGDYDAATVAEESLECMTLQGEVKPHDFRIIYRSGAYPSVAFSYAHNLAPAFKSQLTQCFFEYRFPESMQAIFTGADRFVPINYQEHWQGVRELILHQKPSP